MASQQPLTFGVELEFLTPYLKRGFEDPLSADTRYMPTQSPPPSRSTTPTSCNSPARVTNSVIMPDEKNSKKDPMRDNIVTQVFHVLDVHACIPLRIAKVYPSQMGEDGIYKEHRVWNLTEEESLEELNMGDNVPDAYSWVGVEVTSPVFTAEMTNSSSSSNNREIYCVPKEEDKRQLHEVCKSLREKVRCTVNQGTGDHKVGMHVHVGRGGHGFTLLEMKKFATLMWISEPIWMGLHASWRNGYRYARLMSKVSNLAILTGESEDTIITSSSNKELEERERERERESSDNHHHHQQQQINNENVNTILMSQHLPPTMTTTMMTEGRLGEKMKLLWQAESMEELIWYLSRGNKVGRMGMGFRELVSNANKAKPTEQKTVEWRHMQGSLDPENIVQWTIVCLRMVQLAVDDRPEAFKHLLETVHGALLRSGEDSSIYTGVMFLVDIGLVDQARWFGAMRERIEKESIPTATEEEGWDGLFLDPLESWT